MFRYIFPILGILLCLSAFYLDRRASDFLEISRSTTGTVIDLIASRTPGSFAKAPVVQFESPFGTTHTFLSNVYTTPPAYKVGEQVRVLYDPSDPIHSARVDSLLSIRGVPLILYAVGGVFVVLGSIILWVTRRAQ